jgi:hypothetical protein
LDQELLGGLPTDEDEIPFPNENGQPLAFDFFGLGQPGPAPFNPPTKDPEIAIQAEWGPWLQRGPDVAPATEDVFAPHQEQVPDLNMLPLDEDANLGNILGQ